MNRQRAAKLQSHQRHPKDMALGMGFLLCMSLCLLFSVVHSKPNFHQQCLSFTPEKYIFNSTREVLEYVATGTNLTFPSNDPSCARGSQVVAANVCRVALSIPTSNRSSITFEAWLPEEWSGRFLATGNGGIDGCKPSLRFSRIFT